MKKYFNKVLPTLLVAALMLGTFQLVRSATPAEADVGGAGIAIGEFIPGWEDNETTANGTDAADGEIDDVDVSGNAAAERDMAANADWTPADAGIKWNSTHETPAESGEGLVSATHGTSVHTSNIYHIQVTGHDGIPATTVANDDFGLTLDDIYSSSSTQTWIDGTCALVGVKYIDIKDDTVTDTADENSMVYRFQVSADSSSATADPSTCGTLNGAVTRSPILYAPDGATVTASATLTIDTRERTVTATLEIDNEGPDFSNFSPADETVTDSKALTISSDITDGDSGLDEIVFFDSGTECEEADFFKYVDPDLGYKQPRFLTIDTAIAGIDCSDVVTDTVTLDDAGVATTYAFSADAGVDIDGEVVTVTPSTATDVTAGQAIEDKLNGGRTIEADTTYSFTTAVAADDEWSVARTYVGGGNAFIYELTPSTAVDGDVTTATLATSINTAATNVDYWFGALAIDEAGVMSVVTGGANEVQYDEASPAIASARAGIGWDEDPDVEAEEDDRASIAVLFTELGAGLDVDSLSVDDFVITDDDDNVLTAIGVELDTKTVYIKLDADLAPDATPNVAIEAGDIHDLAGNDASGGNVDASDKIDPSITLSSQTETLVKADETVVFSIVSDEPLSARPSVTVYKATGNANAASVGVSVADVGDDDQAWDITVSGIVAGADREGYWGVYVSGSDVGGNTATLGEADAAAATDEDDDGDFEAISEDAIGFEADTTDVAAPSATTPTDDDTVTYRSPYFVTITLDDGDEYDGDSSDVLTVTEALLVDEDDNEVDISGNIQTSDNNKFRIALTDLALATHEIHLSVEDGAGNTFTTDPYVLTFTVEEAGAVEVDLQPGWNLVSLEGEPTDGSVATVFDADHSATKVFTYDNSASAWVSATRESGGTWEGDLTALDGQHGYWIYADTFTTLEVTVPSGISDVPPTPPTIALGAGWNLVPVVPVDGAATRDADDYFASVRFNLTRVLSYNADTGTWVSVLLDNDLATASGNNKDVTTGSAYWVYMLEADTLVP
ncbi:MAG: hypothetical protein CL786_00460 [Chloroflexi bacterium]|nr:hypothetical protein [Chloroflexota bacterium]